MSIGIGIGIGTSLPSWTPAQLSSLFAWYDAASTNITLDGSNNVSQWNDLSGHSYHATNASAGNRPGYDATGNGRVISLITTFLQAAGSPSQAQPYQVYAAIKPTSATPATGGAYIFDSGAGNESAVLQAQTTGLLSSYAGGSGVLAGSQLTAAAHVIKATFNGASSKVAIDGGADQGSGTSTIPGTSAIGAKMTLGSLGGGGSSFGFRGDIYSIIVCSAILSATDESLLIAYLKTRFGIT